MTEEEMVEHIARKLSGRVHYDYRHQEEARDYVKTIASWAFEEAAKMADIMANTLEQENKKTPDVRLEAKIASYRNFANVHLRARSTAIREGKD